MLSICIHVLRTNFVDLFTTTCMFHLCSQIMYTEEIAHCMLNPITSLPPPMPFHATNTNTNYHHQHLPSLPTQPSLPITNRSWLLLHCICEVHACVCHITPDSNIFPCTTHLVHCQNRPLQPRFQQCSWLERVGSVPSSH